MGDGWAPLFITPDDYGPALGALRQETEAAGRHPDAVEPAVVIFARVGPDDEAPARGAAWLSDMYGVPPKAFERHLVAGEPETCAAALGQYVEAGARHIIVMVAGTGAVGHFELLRSAFLARSASRPGGASPHEVFHVSQRSVTTTDVAILGTGMTDMSRRDLSPETMAYQAAHEALADAGLSPDELGLVIVGNATAGRLNDQACVRGQSWLRKAGLSDVPIVNVDNSCAGGSSALHLATMVAVRLGPPCSGARRREDVDGEPGRDDGRDRGRVAGRLPS